MKRTVLILAFCAIAACGRSQTLLSPSQMAITTNDFTTLSTNGTLRNALQFLGGYLASNQTMSGSCTNYQTNTFTRPFVCVPVVVAAWTNMVSNSWISVQSVTTSNCVFIATPQTNLTMNWIAR